MWLLECDDSSRGEDSVFRGNRLWLRPGTRHLFGRVRNNRETESEYTYVVDDKTISRKHLIIEVGKAEDGDISNANARSEIILEDLKTKIGTLLNGTSIKGQRHVLQGEEHNIRLGRYDPYFRITWHPVVLTHSFTRKNLQTDSVKLILQQLESLDIKFINDFVRESTTHVLAKKRNTPKTLQALIDGKYIVQQDSFLQAIISVADPRPNGKSQLEVNFDDFWPNALNHLPPQGNEPTQVSVDAYSPDLERQTVFQGYTFLFIDKSQHSNLFSPISNGGGKALLKEVEPGVTVIHEFVGYIKSIAHEEGLGEFEDGSEGAGVVLVEYLNEGPTNEWYTHFITQVSQLLNHRPITQSEFLDAILRKNASVLRRPLEPAPSGVPPSSAASPILNRQALQPVAAESSANRPTLANATPQPPPNKTGKSRRGITSRYKGFDETMDISDEPEAIPVQKDNDTIDQASQESSMFVSQRDEGVVQSQPAPSQSRSQLKSSRKRSAPIDEVSVMDQLAPTTLGLKRRRLEEQAARRQRGSLSPRPTVVEKPKPEPAKTKQKKPEKEIDVLEIARQRREEKAAIAEADRADAQARLEDLDINAVRSLIIVEEVPILSGLRASSEEHVEESVWDEKTGGRWDEKTGRLDFKLFKRRGQGAGDNRSQRVIVELEQVSKKDHGIGDEYWLDSDGGSKQKKNGKGKRKESQSQLGRKGKISMGDDWDELDDVMDQSDPPGPVSQNTSTMRSQHTQKLAEKSSVSKTSQNKRPAAAPLTNPAPAKKARPMVQEEDSDDSDDDDDGKFKFRRRK